MNTPEQPRESDAPRPLRQTAPVYRTHEQAADRRRGRGPLISFSTVLLIAVIGGAVFFSGKIPGLTKDSGSDPPGNSVAGSDSSASGSSSGSSGSGPGFDNDWVEPGSDDDGSGSDDNPESGKGSGDAGDKDSGGDDDGSGSEHSSGPSTELSAQVAAILKKRCFSCHGQAEKVKGFVVTNHSLLLDTAGKRPADERYVVAGDLEASTLWQRVGGEYADMPPEDSEQLTSREIAAIRSWIESDAAPFPVQSTRPHVPRLRLWQLVRDDLKQADEADRPHLRYFSVLNLHNDSFTSEQTQGFRENYSQQELQMARGAVSKLVNSLSYLPTAVPPRPLGDQQVVLRIDLRDYGWSDRKVWDTLQESYPYGIDLRFGSNESLQEIVDEVVELAGTDMPVLRADWFIDTAPRGELYYTIMELPNTVTELEDMLGVDPIADFRENRLKRAGFIKSGVSKSNRLVDRHEFNSERFGRGVYWKSYDFLRSDDRGSIVRFPLGPKFKGSEFSDFAFEHDGGEMIFSLPNGLQAYYLGNAKEERLTDGPIEVVEDSATTSGTPVVVNAISCMACHHSGMIPFTDDVRGSKSTPLGMARRKVQDLYATADEMAALVRKDQLRFRSALLPLLAPFIDGAADQVQAAAGDTAGTKVAEPIKVTAKKYQEDLDVARVAAELGFQNPQELLYRIRHSSRLREIGLAPLLTGGRIKRATWSSTAEKQFHTVASELELGTPINKVPPQDLPPSEE